MKPSPQQRRTTVDTSLVSKNYGSNSTDKVDGAKHSKSGYKGSKTRRRRSNYIFFCLTAFFSVNFCFWILFLRSDLEESPTYGEQGKFSGSLPSEIYLSQDFQLLILLTSQCEPLMFEAVKSADVEGMGRVFRRNGKFVVRRNISIDQLFLEWKKPIETTIESLKTADFNGDEVSLRIAASCMKVEVLYMMESFLKMIDWDFGSKSVIVGSKLNWDLPGGSWAFATSNEFVFILRPSFVVKPSFYKMLKATRSQIVSSGSSLKIYGIDISPQVPRSNSTHLKLKTSSTCQLIFPSVWQSFSYLDPNLPPPPPRKFKPRIVYKFNELCSDSWQGSVSSILHYEGGFNLNFPCTLCGLKSPKFLKAKEGTFETKTKHSLAVLSRYSVCGTTLQAPKLAVNMDELAEILYRIQVNRTVIAVMSSEGFEDMLLNWLCFIAELDISNYIIVSDSLDQATRMVEQGHSAFHLKLPASADRSLDYGTIGYKQFILERTRMVLSILRLKFNVLLADVDAVWLSNPFDHMRSTEFDIFAQLEASGHLCGGFLYLRCTSATIETWQKVTSRFEETVEKMMQEAPLVSPRNKTNWLKHYEHLHEQRYLNFFVRQNNSKVAAKGLDLLRFPNGRDFFVYQKPQRAKVHPVVIHNNYIVGKMNKIRRFREMGLWRLSPDNFCYCLKCRAK